MSDMEPDFDGIHDEDRDGRRLLAIPCFFCQASFAMGLA